MLVTINSLGNSICIMNKAVRSDDGTFTKTAITKESLYASGIPENAVPAKAFFVDDSISKEEAKKKKYINEIKKIRRGIMSMKTYTIKTYTLPLPFYHKGCFSYY